MFNCDSIRYQFTGKDPHRRRNGSSGGIHLDLHHVHGRCSPTWKKAPPLNLSALEVDDENRVRSMVYRVGEKSSDAIRTTTTVSDTGVRSPLVSGIVIGVGNYIVKVQLGTPATSFLMVVDTGSSFNWLQCKPCSVSCHYQIGSIFDPKSSTTYAKIHCDSNVCSHAQAATLSRVSCNASVLTVSRLNIIFHRRTIFFSLNYSYRRITDSVQVHGRVWRWLFLIWVR